MYKHGQEILILIVIWYHLVPTCISANHLQFAHRLVILFYKCRHMHLQGLLFIFHLCLSRKHMLN